MPLFRHDGTSYRQVAACSRAAGAAFQTITGRWFYASGLWQRYFSSAPALVVNLTNHTITGESETNLAPPPATLGGSASVTFNADGTLTWERSLADGSTTGGGYTGEWLTTGSSADAELFVSAVSTGAGTLTGPTGAWNSLATARLFTHTTGGIMAGSSALTCQIRNKNTLVVLDTATITIGVN